MKQITKIAIFGREVRSGYLGQFALLLDALSSGKVSFVWYAPFYEQLLGKGLKLPYGEVFTSSEDLPEDVNLFLSLGGDGTFLSSVTYVRDRGIPVPASFADWFSTTRRLGANLLWMMIC